MTLAWWIARSMQSQPVLFQLAITAVFAVLLLAVEYPVFKLGDLKDRLGERLFRRAQPSPEELTPVA
jgi:hypothetical protein